MSLRPFWFALLVVASAVLTTVYTCITPFAAFAVIAGAALSHRSALALTGAVWLANQAVGFVLLHYPWTLTTLAWGIGIGVAAVLATLAAQWTLATLGGFRAPLPTLAGFASAFAIYQVLLYAVALTPLGGTGAFTAGIIAHVLLINAVTLVGLVGLDQLVQAAGSRTRRRREQTSPARFA